MLFLITHVTLVDAEDEYEAERVLEAAMDNLASSQGSVGSTDVLEVRKHQE